MNSEPLISYAQNLEDVILDRCFDNIDKGFYIDVGAAWEKSDSVTKAFYEKGWRGINIEPNGNLFAELERVRVRDINLQILASDNNDSEIEITLLDNPGLSTCDDKIMQKHIKDGCKVSSTEVLPTKTLRQICSEYVPEKQQVHFLKIDVEGFEKKVIQGNDWGIYRPWVLVIESVKPMSQEPSYEEWEHILFDNKYKFAYDDGLNRFYVADEHSELLQYFKYPPNIWDNYRLYSNVALHEELRALRQSMSWKVTKPLRWLCRMICKKK